MKPEVVYDRDDDTQWPEDWPRPDIRQYTHEMTEDEARRWGISEQDRPRFLRVVTRGNIVPPGTPDQWYEIVPVDMGDGGPPGEAARRWKPPEEKC